jgi:hypothetical protein
LNQKGTPAFYSDTYINRPTYGFAGRVFISTDTGQIFEDTGSAWSLIADAGVGGGTLGSVCANGNSTSAGIIITAGGLSSNSITNTSLTTGSIIFSDGGGLESQNNTKLYWDNTNFRLGIGNNSPGAPLDIHGTGTQIQVNGTGSNNSYIQFQNAGTSKWRIGNTYSAGANTFDIYNNGLSTNAISISSTTNNITLTGSLNASTYYSTAGIFLSTGGQASSGGGYATINGGTNYLDFRPANGGIFLFQFPYTTTRTFTLPDATGTLALTSQIPSLTGYVPYTGATTDVNLGTFGLTLGNNLLIKGNNTSQGGFLGFKQFNSTQINQDGYTAFSAVNSNILYLSYSTGVGTSKYVLFDNTYITNNSGITLYFPNASGTLALTSDLSSYLPLTGGTLTGQLYINPTNTATTGLDVASDTIRFRSDNLEGFKRQLLITMGSGTLVQLTAQGYGANYGTDLAFYTATTGGVNASPGIYITGTNNRVGIKNGTPVYDLDVTGTLGVSSAATFSSSVDATIFNSTSNAFRFSGSNALSLVTLSSQNVVKINAAGYWGVQLVGANDTGILINSTGNVLIGQTADDGGRLTVKAAGNTSSYYAIVVRSSTADLFYARGDGFINMGLQSNSPYYYNTTFSPRSAALGAGGDLGYIVSTRESKGNIESIKNIDFIYNLNPVQFNYRKKNNDNTEFINEVYDDLYYGFIADEVEKVNKELVFYDNLKDGTKKLSGVEYNSIIAILTKAIQELNEKLVRNNIN